MVDTNVLVAANGKATHADLLCQKACVDALIDVKEQGTLLVDSFGLILEEYRRGCASSPSSQGIGTQFYRWAMENVHNLLEPNVEPVAVSQQGNSFVEFPADPDLNAFDDDDHKFVAVALGGAPACVVNATDSDWADHYAALDLNGVDVIFLCPEICSPESCRG